MAMTEKAATRSPKNLIFRVRREAEKPVKKRTGTVPRPKKAMLKNPMMGFWVVAALMIIAQESMQGKNPVATPRANLEARDWDLNRVGNRRLKNDPPPMDGTRKGTTFKRTSPKRTIKIPPPRVTTLRRSEKK